jgi:hypothetical protein
MNFANTECGLNILAAIKVSVVLIEYKFSPRISIRISLKYIPEYTSHFCVHVDNRGSIKSETRADKRGIAIKLVFLIKCDK